jgi:biopolymer transport protein ExbD
MAFCSKGNAMSRNTRSRRVELSTSSMADIAFLLLTFFLITTQIQQDKGLSLLLPPWSSDPVESPVNKRNVFSVQINSHDQFLVEGLRRDNLTGLRQEIRSFLMNSNSDLSLSESPAKAVVSLKTDRGTTYKTFVQALDEIQAAYFELYAERAGITPQRFRSLDMSIPAEKLLYAKAREGIPMNISIAEPTVVKY